MKKLLLLLILPTLTIAQTPDIEQIDNPDGFSIAHKSQNLLYRGTVWTQVSGVLPSADTTTYRQGPGRSYWTNVNPNNYATQGQTLMMSVSQEDRRAVTRYMLPIWRNWMFSQDWTITGNWTFPNIYTKAQTDAAISAAQPDLTNVYTKAQADTKYALAGTSYTKSEADLRYLQSAPVTTVNTKSGAVSLTTTDIPEGTNQYFTPARVTAVGDPRYQLASAKVRYFKGSGEITQTMKIWEDVLPVTTGNGMTIDISSAGFSTITNIQFQPAKNTSTPTDQPQVVLKTFTTTQLTVNVFAPITVVVAALPISFLSNVSGVTLHVRVEGY